VLVLVVVLVLDSIELSDHLPVRGEQRGYTEEQALTCIQYPDRIVMTEGHGIRGGLIWKFRKSALSQIPRTPLRLFLTDFGAEGINEISESIAGPDLLIDQLIFARKIGRLGDATLPVRPIWFQPHIGLPTLTSR
jgi:hypothetical protein